MTKSQYGKKVVKSVVLHRTCRTCQYWQKSRPGIPVRTHRCVKNHIGSARMIEAKAGCKAIQELAAEGTPVEILEGDGDSTLISRLREHHNIKLKKKLDKNHVIKNIVKKLHEIAAEKGTKLSKSVIGHLKRVIQYVFAKNKGDPAGMEENLKAVVPHQFGDHSLCTPRFCGYKRAPTVRYAHRSLPYQLPLSDPLLRKRLDEFFVPIIAKAATYTDLGSSQQNEHANREVTLRAPKHLHYGGSESLDFRVSATAAFINEGREYIPKVSLLSSKCWFLLIFKFSFIFYHITVFLSGC